MSVSLRRDKKGDSVIIGYVLLIVLTIGMAAGVYAYLRFYLPKDQPTCPNDVSLTIENISCSSGQLALTLNNRGLFSIDGAYVKVGRADRVYKETLCLNGADEGSPNCDVMFHRGGIMNGPLEALVPGGKLSTSLEYTSTGETEVEIEPIMLIDDEYTRALCENAIVSQTVTCT